MSDDPWKVSLEARPSTYLRRQDNSVFVLWPDQPLAPPAAAVVSGPAEADCAALIVHTAVAAVLACRTGRSLKRPFHVTWC